MSYVSARRAAFLTLPLAASLLCSTAARADLTADQVWENWQSYYTDMGYKIDAGSTERAGDTLTLSDVTMVMEASNGTTTATLDRVVMTEMRGAVHIRIPAEIPVMSSATSESGEKVETGLNVTQDGMEITVSGDPEDITYETAANRAEVALTSLVIDGKPVEMTGKMTITRPSGTGRMAGTDARAVEYKTTADSLAFAMAGTDPETPGSSFTVSGSLADLSGEGAMHKPAGVIDTADLNAALAAGMVVEGRFAYGQTDVTFDLTEAENAAKGTFTAASGSGDLKMADGLMDYRSEGRDAKVHVEAAQIPFPIDLSMAEAVMGMQMPLIEKPEAAPFGLETRLIDFSVNDDIWGLIDPQATLPRDPATLILKLSGLGKVVGNALSTDPAVAADSTLDLEALKLEELKLTIAGADLSGAGAFTFDPADTTTFPGMPRPEGSVDLRLLGGNTLLDKIVALGLVPSEQAMGIRMMAGLFANAGPGEDELNSKIEVRDDGGLYANGQRIR